MQGKGQFVYNIGKISIRESPHCYATTNAYNYYDPTSDEAILHDISPVLVSIKELTVQQEKEDTIHQYDPDTLDTPIRRSFISTDRHKSLTAAQIADLWFIGPKQAMATLNATTQRG